VLFLNSASAYSVESGEGIYVAADGSLGYYNYSVSNPYYFSHYPDTYYDGYYTDIVYYDDYYYYPTYDTYYYPAGSAHYTYYTDGYYPYAGYVVPDGYYLYPPVMPVDGYYAYPPTAVPNHYGGFDVVYDVFSPVYTFLDYYVPYSNYGYYDYYVPYNSYAYYPSYATPSGIYSGFEGSAGTVTVERDFDYVATEPEPEEDNFKHYIVEKNYYGYDDPPEETTETVVPDRQENSTNTYVVIAEDYQLQEETQAPAEEEEKVIYFSDMPQASCQSIALDPVSVDVKAGEMTSAVLRLQNNSFEDFYVERFNIYSLNSAIEVYEDSFDNKILASGSGTLTARFYADQGASNTEAYLQVYGHFENGKSCGFNEIKEQFDIYILPGSPKAECQDFQLTVPNKLSPEANELSFSVSNPLDKPARILIKSEGLTINPSVVEVPAKTFMEKTVYFDGQSNSIRYKILMEGCTFNDRMSYFNQNNGDVELMSFTSKVKLAEDNKVYITLKNKSAVAKQVNLALLDLPPGFKTEGQVITLQPSESRTVELEVEFDEAEAAVQFDSTLTISFAGSQIEKSIPVNLNADELSLRAEVLEMVSGNYGLKVYITNNTNHLIEGEITLPNDFKVLGENYLIIEPAETKAVILSIAPDKALNREQFIPVTFEQTNGKAFLTYAKFSPLKGAVATAFLSLTSSAVVLGAFIVLLAIVVYLANEKGLFEKLRLSKAQEEMPDDSEETYFS
jgi:hypothetical protein